MLIAIHFNPITGEGSCIKLGLTQFQNPMYSGWSDLLVMMGMQMWLEQRTARKMVGYGVDAFPGTDNADPMGNRTRTQTANSKQQENIKQ